MHVRDTHSERAGAHAVLLLHGAPSTTHEFEPLVQELTHRGARVIVPELPGYGRSGPLTGAYDWVQVAKELEDSLISHGILSCDVVGFSGGVYRAFQIALGNRVAVGTIVGLGPIAGLDDAARRAFHEAVKAAREGADLRIGWLERMGGPVLAGSADGARAVMGWLDAISLKDLATEIEAFANAEDLRPRLASLNCQVVLRVGELDAATPPALAREIATLIPNVALTVVPGVGHALLFEDRDATIAATLSALADRGRALESLDTYT